MNPIWAARDRFYPFSRSNWQKPGKWIAYSIAAVLLLITVIMTTFANYLARHSMA
ncbi:hypothetical protein [Ktedonosporobacter rubrisoli]|uniref:hypothetical protein n=1 Tax=Ktedonosporobacter rubrisoli TaxID=2509675 RepID=UPI0013EEE69A|nr:hypothetical protein [Ktedonosporobacter rubrisoli]